MVTEFCGIRGCPRNTKVPRLRSGGQVSGGQVFLIRQRRCEQRLYVRSLWETDCNCSVSSAASARQIMVGGSGVNIFTYLTAYDFQHPELRHDRKLQSRRDVIDLSRVDGDLTQPGVQNFTFIGTAQFDGKGPEVRVYQDVANNETYVEGALRRLNLAQRLYPTDGPANADRGQFRSDGCAVRSRYGGGRGGQPDRIRSSGEFAADVQARPRTQIQRPGLRRLKPGRPIRRRACRPPISS